MRCPEDGSEQSGDSCKLCGKVFKAKKEKPAGIKQKSDRLAAEDREYKKLRIVFLKENPKCAVYPWLPATEVHHKRGRGIYFLDVTTFLPVSNRAHRKITDNPKWAEEKGYSEPRLKNYDQTKEAEKEESPGHLHP